MAQTLPERVLDELNRRGGRVRWALRQQRWLATDLGDGTLLIAHSAGPYGFAAYTCTGIRLGRPQHQRFVAHTHLYSEPKAGKLDPREVADRLALLVKIHREAEDADWEWPM